MKEKKQSDLNKTRRAFLTKGTLAGTTLLLGMSSGQAVEEEEECIKLITASGQLVTVNKRFIPDLSGKQVTKKELIEWKSLNKK